MRLHVSKHVDSIKVYEAARIARVDLDLSHHGSRKADHAFEVTLTGESKRRPNSGQRGAGDDYAATWDQWGVFLAVLFKADPEMTCWAYANQDDFDHKTNNRFSDDQPGREEGEFWPEDAHGDHSWIVGEPFRQACRRCTAVKVW